uniref:SHSP domain-containing protein n=1 Tax=Meloidogyne javanica TaxID=6303 RepID=A0A915N0F0_MELJA
MPLCSSSPLFWPVAEPRTRSSFCSRRFNDDFGDFFNVPRTVSIYWPTLNGAFEQILNDGTHQINDLLGNIRQTDDSLFKFSCDAFDYRPGEIEVKIDGEELIITAEHKKEDEHQSIHRSFTRRVQLPKNIKKETIECSVDSNGQFNVTAELIKPEKKQEEKQKAIKIPIKIVGEKGEIEGEKAKTEQKAEEKKD